MTKSLNLLLNIALVMIFATYANGQGITPVCSSLTAGNLTYTQNFNTLSANGGSGLVPAGIGFFEGGADASTVYVTGNGSSSSANTYSFGATNSTDRAFGSLQSTTINPYVGGCFTNNTGGVLSGFSVSYDGEMWRLGKTGGPADRLDFQYSKTATNLGNGTWIDVNAADFTSPVTSGTVGAINGNVSPNRTAGINATVTGMTVANGASFYVRWLDYNLTTRVQDGLAVDNLTLVATAASPGTVQFRSSAYSHNEDHGTIAITLTRLGGSSGAASVAYATTGIVANGGPACNIGIDFISTGGTVNWANGDSLDKTISVTLCSDALFENITPETVQLDLSDATGASLGSPARSILTIIDTTVPPTLSFDEAADNLPESGPTYTFVVIRSGDTTAPISVNYATSNGTATGDVACTAGVDYISKIGTLSFDANVDMLTIPVTICNDSRVEGGETFTANLSNPGGGATLGTFSTQPTTIDNDDTAGVLITQSNGSTDVSEQDIGNPDSYTIVLTSEPSADVTVTIPVPWDADTDPSAVIFTPANWFEPQTITVTAHADTDYMGNHTTQIIHEATSGDTNYNAIPITDITVNITDIQPATMQFSAATFQGPERPTSISIDVLRTGLMSSTATVQYATTDIIGTATVGTCGTPGVDYEATSGTLTFAADETAKTFFVTVCRDTLSENPAENFIVTLSSPTSGIVGSRSDAVVTILDSATEFDNIMPIATSTGSAASVYPVLLDVSGMPNRIQGLRITLYGVTQTVPEDMDVLLVSPDGARKIVVMADVGGSNALSNQTITIEDAATINLYDSAAIVDGQNYKPTNCTANIENFPSPAPVGPYSEPGCSGGITTIASVFGGVNPNGTWKLYIRDHAITGPSTELGAGSVDGWGIQFLGPTAASATLGGRAVTADGRGIPNAWIRLSDLDGTLSRVAQTGSMGYFTIDNMTVGSTYVLSIHSDRFPFSNPTKVVTIFGDGTEIEFIADPLQ